MLLAGFELAIPASDRSLSLALDSLVTDIGHKITGILNQLSHHWLHNFFFDVLDICLTLAGQY